jgi:lipopolysaccharide/colanic/teichoic acid biosynthesis glycosyltransferase
MTSIVRAVADTKKIPSSMESQPVMDTDFTGFIRPVAVSQRVVQPQAEHHATAVSRIEPPRAESVVDPRRRPMQLLYESAKRIFDLLLGSVLLIIAIPIILIAAVAIRIETRGSPFFIQTRLGKDGRPFRICKLRGMYADAKVRFPSYYDYSS